MLLVHIPDTYIPERTYIISTIMQYLLDLDIKIQVEKRSNVLLEISSIDAKKLFVADILFQTPHERWLTNRSLPEQPLSVWDTTDILPEDLLTGPELPVIYGTEIINTHLALNYMEEKSDEVNLGIDVFGSAFYMLTRYEEVVKPDRDRHDRFPAAASLAWQEGFLDRPIINEYIEILWYCMKRLWPGLEKKPRYFRMLVSHDVDVPFAQAFSGIPRLIRNCSGDIIRRKSLFIAIDRIKNWQDARIAGLIKQDFNYTFDNIMDISEQHNMISSFYLKTDYTNTKFDNKYSINHPYIRQLMRDIYDRGHEIGLHPSYETYKNPKQTKAEFERLLQACEEENIKQEVWGGRQHYLRWQVPVTWHNWAEAGLNYDSSLSYADYAGFRCGFCYEFPVFDLKQQKHLNLTERPLVIMEGSVMGKLYMNLSGSDALAYMLRLKNRCRHFQGDFTLLWHNSSFDTPEMWETYKRVIVN